MKPLRRPLLPLVAFVALLLAAPYAAARARPAPPEIESITELSGNRIEVRAEPASWLLIDGQRVATFRDQVATARLPPRHSCVDLEVVSRRGYRVRYPAHPRRTGYDVTSARRRYCLRGEGHSVRLGNPEDPTAGDRAATPQVLRLSGSEAVEGEPRQLRVQLREPADAAQRALVEAYSGGRPARILRREGDTLTLLAPGGRRGEAPADWALCLRDQCAGIGQEGAPLSIRSARARLQGTQIHIHLRGRFPVSPIPLRARLDDAQARILRVTPTEAEILVPSSMTTVPRPTLTLTTVGQPSEQRTERRVRMPRAR